MSSKKRRPVINVDECKGCQLCVQFCKPNALAIGNGINRLGYRYAVLADEDACTGCAICARMCPDAVIEVWEE